MIEVRLFASFATEPSDEQKQEVEAAMRNFLSKTFSTSSTDFSAICGSGSWWMMLFGQIFQNLPRALDLADKIKKLLRKSGHVETPSPATDLGPPVGRNRLDLAAFVNDDPARLMCLATELNTYCVNNRLRRLALGHRRGELGEVLAYELQGEDSASLSYIETNLKSDFDSLTQG